MATVREWVCRRGCRKHAGSLFSALLDLAREQQRNCATHELSQVLQLRFDFGLNAQHKISTVLGCFTPRRPPSWKGANGRPVQFFPFLVVVRRHGKREAAWLPYWHLVGTRGRKEPIKKYGQWAPYMDMHLFHDLLRQARSRGFLRG